MAFPPLLVLGLYRPISVARAFFALPRSHRGEVRLTAGRSESSLDSHEVLIIFNQYVDEPGVLQTQIKSNSCTFFLTKKKVMK
jgi:hypothetical protein